MTKKLLQYLSGRNYATLKEICSALDSDASITLQELLELSIQKKVRAVYEKDGALYTTRELRHKFGEDAIDDCGVKSVYRLLDATLEAEDLNLFGEKTPQGHPNDPAILKELQDYADSQLKQGAAEAVEVLGLNCLDVD